MFDVEVHQHRHVSERVTKNVTVHEHRAPTDESVRLLKEMQTKAQDAVLEAIRLEDAPIDGVIHVMDNIMTTDREYRIVYKLGGARRIVEHTEPIFLDDRAEKEKRITNLRDALARDIANGLLESMLRVMDKSRKL